MLGPNDIDDWTDDEADRLRAEIRLLPVFQSFRREPKPVAGRLGSDLSARLRKFCKNADMPLAQLGALLDDLRKSDSARR